MPVIETTRLGSISYEEDAVLMFPRGLPGFESRRKFLAVHLPACDPLVFLQSLEDPGLCFLTAPATAVHPGYRLEIADDDRELLGLVQDGALNNGKDVLCLAVLSVRESGPTANLLAPVVVNLRNRTGVQAVTTATGYSHRQELCAEEAAVCS